MPIPVRLPLPFASRPAPASRARRLSALALAAVALAAVALSAPAQPGASALPAARAAASTYHTGTQTIGYSVRHRPIRLTVIGSPTAPRRAMFVSAIHGNERGGVPITKALARSRPPAGTAYFVISYPNPDGAARNTRQNARRVDLNRNFPGWRRNGSPGYVYYPGTGPLSEPESRAMYNAVRKIRPTLFVTYHQHMNVLLWGGGTATTRKAGPTYARLTGLRRDGSGGPSYRGSQATWMLSSFRSTAYITVELPAWVPASMVRRHVAAAKYIARL